jgi:hypothetical protein
MAARPAETTRETLNKRLNDVSTKRNLAIHVIFGVIALSKRQVLEDRS